jgi:hypothetical protein
MKSRVKSQVENSKVPPIFKTPDYGAGVSIFDFYDVDLDRPDSKVLKRLSPKILLGMKLALYHAAHTARRFAKEGIRDEMPDWVFSRVAAKDSDEIVGIAGYFEMLASIFCITYHDRFPNLKLN